jgi:hypothetical protein
MGLCLRKTEANAGAIDIIGMADDGSVSQRWPNKNAYGIVERQPAPCRDYEAAEDTQSNRCSPSQAARPPLELFDAQRRRQ